MATVAQDAMVAKERKPGRRLLRKALLAAAAGVILFPFYEMGRIYAYGFARDSGAADAAIVLGAAEYNNRPSPVFKERIEHAIHLYRQGRIRAIVFTGGSG